MRMRTIAPFIPVLIVAANVALGQSLAEVAEKEKERRKNNEKEATVIVKNRGVWLVPEEPKPDDETAVGQSESSKRRTTPEDVQECRLAQDTLGELKRDRRELESLDLKLRRKAQTARILDTHGFRELEDDEWLVPLAEGRELLAELTSIRASLADTYTKIGTYEQRLTETCQ